MPSDCVCVCWGGDSHLQKCPFTLAFWVQGPLLPSLTTRSGLVESWGDPLGRDPRLPAELWHTLEPTDLSSGGQAIPTAIFVHIYAGREGQEAVLISLLEEAEIQPPVTGKAEVDSAWPPPVSLTSSS
jgi:hypothetical protein